MKTPEEPPHEVLKRLLETIERETVPMAGHQDPNAINDCWRYAAELVDDLKRKAQKYDELVATVDKYYEMDDNGEFVSGGDLVDIGEAVAHKLGYL